MKEGIISFIGTIISILCICIQVIGFEFTLNIQLIILGIGLFILGIPHGAGDLIISKIQTERKKLKFSSIEFYLKYLGSMVVYGLSWWFNPYLALGIFILISIFHFGELENIAEKKWWLDIILKLFIGSIVLGMILTSHWEESKVILQDMKISSRIIQEIPAESILPLLVFILFFLSLILKNPTLFNSLFTLILGFFLPLILSFTIYFVLCHSLNSIRKVQFFTKLNYLNLYKKLFPYSIASLGVLIIILISNLNYNYLITNIFIFISIITFPHFFIMHKMLSHQA